MATTTVPDLTPEQLDAFGAELDALRAAGPRRPRRARRALPPRVVRAQRGLEVAGPRPAVRRLPAAGLARRVTAPARCRRSSTTWRSATTSCTASTTGCTTRALRSRPSSGTTPARATQWRHSHNYMHHTYTNVRGPRPRHRLRPPAPRSRRSPGARCTCGNPLYAAPARRCSSSTAWRSTTSRSSAGAAARERPRRWCAGRDPVPQDRRASRSRTTCCSRCSPARRPPLTFAGNAAANLLRNLWSFTIIFCGHFPDGVAHLHRGGGRAREPRRLVPPPAAAARPTSTAARCSTC